MRPGRANGPCSWMSTCGGRAWAVFSSSRTGRRGHGLVDVLRGEMPWQRTVRHTEIANLDFMPTGDTSEIPIEILGTLELRQLLVALEHHYDRVILDGPAVLGLADCRVLGRIVDASLLVVRSGSHHLTTLHRAKAMLEQSHVLIAGVVFNGMTDDMNNWSSYGYEPLPSSSVRSKTRAGEPEPLALAASHKWVFTIEGEPPGEPSAIAGSAGRQYLSGR